MTWPVMELFTNTDKGLCRTVIKWCSKRSHVDCTLNGFYGTYIHLCISSPRKGRVLRLMVCGNAITIGGVIRTRQGEEADKTFIKEQLEAYFVEDRFNFKLVNLPNHMPCLNEDIWRKVYDLLPGKCIFDRCLKRGVPTKQRNRSSMSRMESRKLEEAMNRIIKSC